MVDNWTRRQALRRGGFAAAGAAGLGLAGFAPVARARPPAGHPATRGASAPLATLTTS
jgi:hypothetical protein